MLFCGFPLIFELFHDMFLRQGRWAGTQLDNFYHNYLDIISLSVILYAFLLPAAVWLLAKAVIREPRRARVVGLVWLCLGLSIYAIVAINYDYVVSITNNPSYKRVSPLEPGILNAQISWIQMTFTELLFLCLMSLGGAGIFYLRRKGGPAVSTALIIFFLGVSLFVYCWIAAPWAFVYDFDNFIGDMVLGSVAGNLFFGSQTVYAYSVSISVMVAIWKPWRPPEISTEVFS